MIRRIQFGLACLLLLASCHRPAEPIALTGGPGAPHPGFYRCWAGGFEHLPAGTFTLSGNGHYESYRPGGGGRYAFSPNTSAIDFLDGDYHYWEYRGIFQRAIQSSAGSSNGARDRIVLMPLGVTDSIGTERPGEYQYCYLEATPSASQRSQ